MDRTQSVYPNRKKNWIWSGLQTGLGGISLLFLISLPVISLLFFGESHAVPIAQATAAQQIPTAQRDVITRAIHTSSSQEISAGEISANKISAAIQAAELLVLKLGQATANPEAPIESLQWLTLYFQQGWAPGMASKLASYYSYFDGTHYYLRFTDDILPPLAKSTTIKINETNGQTAVVQAQFPAVDGPFQSPASTRRYFLIKEQGTWKITAIKVDSSVTTGI